MSLMMLGMFKDIQEKVYAEIMQVLPSPDDKIDFDALNKLKYLEQVIKESLRLFPIAAVVLRKTSDDFKLDDYIIPAETTISIRIYNIQRDKRYWGEDANEFNPERFEEERIKNVPAYAFIPFTGNFLLASICIK